MTMPHFSDQQVRDLLDYDHVIDALDMAFKDLASGAAVIHPRQRTDAGAARLNTMGAVWSAKGVAGVKAYPTVAGSFSFLIALFDVAANQPLATFDGAELTRLRTAAITALVASKAAAPRPRKMALFGAGVQGRGQLEALLQVFQFEEIAVVDPAASPSWCAAISTRAGCPVQLCSAKDAVSDADIVVTATRSAEPVFDGTWLKRGAFVSAIGTSTAKGRELDNHTMDRANRVIVEWLPQSLVEAGELVLWDSASKDKITELSQHYRGELPWRQAPDDIVVFKSVGVGLADVACAYAAFSRASQRPGATTQHEAAP